LAPLQDAIHVDQRSCALTRSRDKVPQAIVDDRGTGGRHDVPRRVSDKESGLMTDGFNITGNITLGAAGFITGGEDELLGCPSSVNPCVNREIVGPHDEVAARGGNEDIAAAVEIEGQPDLARRIAFGALPGTRAMVLEIVGSAIAGPPILQVSGRRNTLRLALARAAGIDDGLDLWLC